MKTMLIMCTAMVLMAPLSARAQYINEYYGHRHVSAVRHRSSQPRIFSSAGLRSTRSGSSSSPFGTHIHRSGTHRRSSVGSLGLTETRSPFSTDEDDD